ncbi:MAG: adaptor protein MecA [Clostridia bacterium]|jgi:adapter protein MecA 1/2|nr:adaptor protein MecA [Clostridia bacterium]
MKIRKISDDKVQIIITNQDLEERDFKKWEMMPISPKAQEFFQDILDMAYEECGFEIEDDAQLVVEAYPLSVDSFVVVMTKVQNHGSEYANGFILNQQDSDDFPPVERGAEQVWNFPDLETCSQACARLENSYIEESLLYRYQDRYYLAVSILPDKQDEIAAILGEYAEWFPLDEVFLKEYGKTVVPRNAVANMGSLIPPSRQ